MTRLRILLLISALLIVSYLRIQTTYTQAVYTVLIWIVLGAGVMAGIAIQKGRQG